MSHAEPIVSNAPPTLATALRRSLPAALFGVRLWAAVCLALYVAYALQLDNAYWAGTSAAIVCQPQLGASLRKGWFRMVGTLVGAVTIVLLTVCFPQSRLGFLAGLALWGGICALFATLLRNFASYAAALAGITAAIIASGELGAVGGANGDAFMLAISRVSEICIGIVAAGIVMAGTDFGGARRRLADQLAAISADIVAGIIGAFRNGEAPSPARARRRDLIRRVIALEPVMDEAFGEAADLRHRAPLLAASVSGLFAALSGWRMAAVHFEVSAGEPPRQDALAVLRALPPSLLRASALGAAGLTADPSGAQRACAAGVRALAALPAGTPSLQLLADRTAEALIGMQRALDAILLLLQPADPIRGRGLSGFAWFRVPDMLPPLLNALRAFVTIGAVELFWIATAWPSGPQAIAFTAITVILFSPAADRAYATAMSFMMGTGLSAVIAGVVLLAVLPGVSGFAGFSLALGAVLVPAGALIAQPWRTPMFVAMVANFIPLLAPTNRMTYDSPQFYNEAIAIVAGVCAGVLAFRLLPPLSPAVRTTRLLALTLRDLRHLTARTVATTASEWEGAIYTRLSALPEQADPLQRAQLLAAISVGTQIIRLRGIARRFDLMPDLAPALTAVAAGDSRGAVERLTGFDRLLAALPAGRPGLPVRLRARGLILATAEALTQHAAYFDAGVRP